MFHFVIFLISNFFLFSQSRYTISSSEVYSTLNETAVSFLPNVHLNQSQNTKTMTDSTEHSSLSKSFGKLSSAENIPNSKNNFMYRLAHINKAEKIKNDIKDGHYNFEGINRNKSLGCT